MRLCDETITLFNKRLNGAGDYVWKPTVLRGVSWFSTQADTIDPKGGYIAADKVTVRIPLEADAGGKTYVGPIAYDAAGDVSGKFTLRKGDVIVKGEAEGDEWTPDRLKKTFDGFMTVLGVTDSTGRPNAPHFRIVGA